MFYLPSAQTSGVSHISFTLDDGLMSQIVCKSVWSISSSLSSPKTSMYTMHRCMNCIGHGFADVNTRPTSVHQTSAAEEAALRRSMMYEYQQFCQVQITPPSPPTAPASLITSPVPPASPAEPFRGCYCIVSCCEFRFSKGNLNQVAGLHRLCDKTVMIFRL